MNAPFACSIFCLACLFAPHVRAALPSGVLSLEMVGPMRHAEMRSVTQVSWAGKTESGLRPQQFTTTRDTINRQEPYAAADTTRVLLLNDLAISYRFNKPDSAVKLAQRAYQLAKSLDYPKGECQALNIMGESMRFQGELLKALEVQLQALRISRAKGYKSREANSLAYVGMIYIEMKEHRHGLVYLEQARKLFDQLDIPVMSSFTLSNIGNAYKEMNRLDSALWFHQQAILRSKGLPVHSLQAFIMTSVGAVEARLGHIDSALQYFWQAVHNAILEDDVLNKGTAYFHLAELYYHLHAFDSSLHYARSSYSNGLRISSRRIQLNASRLLVKIHHSRGTSDSAFHYQQAAMAAQDSLFGPEKFHKLQLMTLAEQERRQQLIREQERVKASYQRISFFLLLGIFLSVAVSLWRSNRQQSLANKKLNDQNEKIKSQQEILRKSLSELEGMQAQLIQNEKITALYEQQLKIQQVRHKIACELHDDIGSGLSSIHLFTEVAKRKLSRENEAALSILEKIEDRSHEMMLAMNEIVWAIQPRNDDVVHFLDRIRSFGRQLLSTKNIELDFDVLLPVQSAPMAMELRRNLYLICKESFNNIVKHSNASKVSVKMEATASFLEVYIKDDGEGFDLTEISDGNGLLSLKSRAHEIGGIITIDSYPHMGTSVFLKVHLGGLSVDKNP